MKLSHAVLVAACTLPSFAEAQEQTVLVSGIVASETGQGLPYSTVSITGGVQRFTSADGSFSFMLPPGKFAFRVRQLGFAPLDTAITVSAGADLRTLVFKLQPVAFRLDAIRTYATSCRSGFRGDLGVLVAELSKNAEREKILRTDYPFIYEMERKSSLRGLGGTTLQSSDTARYLSQVVEGYVPGKLVRLVDSTDPKGAREMRIPTLTDLADPVFIASHCFRVPGVESVGDARAYRIDFEPSKDINAPDVEGSAFIDSSSFLIRKAIFRLTKPQKLYPPVFGLEVTTLYREIFSGVALFEQIHSEQPLNRSARFRATQLEDQKLVAVKFYGRTPEDVVIAEAPAVARPQRDSTARIGGVVVDSSGRPLAHASIIAVEGNARATSSDSGRFLIVGLKPGRTEFRVQVIGYGPATFATELRAGKTRQMKIILTPVNVQLATITVLDSLSDPLLAQTGFFTRRDKGLGGTFISPEEVEKRHPFDATDLLRMVNGVEIVGGSREKSVISRRGAGCEFNVFIDGQPVRLSGGMTLDDVISGREVGAVEVYPTELDTPAKFLLVGRRCGTLVFWTKGWLSPSSEPDSSGEEQQPGPAIFDAGAQALPTR